MPAITILKKYIIERLNFFFDVYSLRQLPGNYRRLRNRYTNETVFENPNPAPTEFPGRVTVVEDVPGYFKVEEDPLPPGTKCIRIKQYPGFLINFEGIGNLAEYLNSRFGKSSRYKLRREKKKLEHCFDIRYKMFYGAISDTEYESIFDELYRLLEIRSLEKGILDNRNLHTRDFYQDIVYPMVLEKKASIYVIYNGEVAIDICVNFHLDNVIFQYLRTYDIAYSKFNTGYTDLMQQIEWCIGNKVNLISFSKGDFYWKRRWCNTVYDYDYHIFYDSESMKARLVTAIYVMKKRLKQWVREKGVIEWYHARKERFDKKRSPLNNAHEPVATPLEYNKDLGPSDAVDYNDPEYRFLRRTIFEFLYDTNERESDLTTHRLSGKAGTFIVSGKEHKVMITAGK